jgi:hypothetical protein
MIPDSHLVGFVEGEGCFSIAIKLYTDRKPRKTAGKRQQKKPAIGFRVSPSFRINIREDDRPILEEIRKRLGVGEIYIQNREKYKNCHNTVHYYVQTFSDLLKVRDFFKQQTFYSKKGKDFELWCQVLGLMEKKHHLTPEGFAAICEIRSHMNSRENKLDRKPEEIQQILQSGREHILAHVGNNDSST